MRLDEFLSSDAFTMVNKKLAKTIGIGQAIYLQELISQRKRFGCDEFYFTQNNMEDELGITSKTQGRYTKELQDKGLMTVNKKGIPAKNYYIINDEAIINIIQNRKTSTDKMSELGETKCPDYSNINNQNNKNSLSGDSKPIKQGKEKMGEHWSDGLTLSENVIERLSEYDKSKKNKFKNFTKKGFGLMIDELKELGHGTDEGMIAVLQQSIKNGWQGLFEVKGFKPTVNYESDLGAFYNEMKRDYEGLKNKLGVEKFMQLKQKALRYAAENKLL